MVIPQNVKKSKSLHPTVHVPRIPAEARALTVASFSTDVGALLMFLVSVLPAVVGSLLFLTSLKVLVLFICIDILTDTKTIECYKRERKMFF